VLALGLVAQAAYWRFRQKNSRPQIKKLPMMTVVDAAGGSTLSLDSPSNSAVELLGSPLSCGYQSPAAPSKSADDGFVDISLAPQSTPGSGTRNTAARNRARVSSSKRGQSSGTASSSDAPPAPVVMHVPLPDLDRPIMANLDANHQIMSTRPE